MRLHLMLQKRGDDRFESVLTKTGYKPRWYSGPSPYLFLNGSGLYNSHQALAATWDKAYGSAVCPRDILRNGGGGFAGRQEVEAAAQRAGNFKLSSSRQISLTAEYSSVLVN